MISVFASLLLAALQQGAAPVTACAAPTEIAGFTGEQAFTQTRTFEGVDLAMVSTGTASIEGETIVWTVSDPISIVTKITGANITQSIEGGPDEPVGSSSAASPLLSQSGMTHLLKGDLKSASALYDIEEPASTPEGWTVALTPKDTDLAELVTSIELTGCTQLDNIHLRQASGDTIAVAFSGD